MSKNEKNYVFLAAFIAVALGFCVWVYRHNSRNLFGEYPTYKVAESKFADR